MKRMTTAELSYYMDRLKYFYNPHQLAERFDVTYATMRRWVALETQPSRRYLKRFEHLLDELIVKLEKGKKLDRLIAVALVDEDPPEPKKEAILKANRQVLTDLLIEMLSRKPLSSTIIFKETDKLGFNRIAVHKEAQRLNIHKHRQGFGPNSHSIWSLPDRDR